MSCNSNTSSSDSDERDKEQDEEEEEKKDIKPDLKKTQITKTARGKLAALMSNLDNSDSSDSDDDKKYLKNKAQRGGGIYTKRLNQTKNEKKVINHKFNEVDKNLVNETDESQSASKVDSSESDSDKSNKSMNGIDTDEENENVKKKRMEKEDSPEPEIELPPPPTKNTPKRGRASFIDKQFKELESLKTKSETKRLLNDSEKVVVSDEEELKTVTVRVSTKSGLRKWEMNENQAFRFIFEKLSELENTGVENLVLMLKDRIINFNDTPASVNLKAYHILDYGKTASVIQEKVKVVEDGDESTHGPNMVTVNLQTDAGRKSRLKFLISMDEPFESVLRKYCEKKSLEFDKHILQMEGDKIDLKETARDLDFEDDYMIDVVRSSKPVLQQINENRKKYEFDDDVLIA